MNLNFANLNLSNLGLANVSLPHLPNLGAALGLDKSNDSHKQSIRTDIDRHRANLFFAIKRKLPAATRADIKIAAPDLAHQLINIYSLSDNAELRQLIEQFFDGTHGDWSKLLIKGELKG